MNKTMFRRKDSEMKMFSVKGLLFAALLTPLAAVAQVSVVVQASVAQNCSVSSLGTTGVDFGLVNVLAVTNVTANGDFRLTCNKGAAPNLTVDTNTRSLVSAGGDTLTWILLQPTGAALGACPAQGAGTAWLTGTPVAASLFGTNGGNRDIKICGELVLPNTAAGAGSYQQTVNLNFTF
jgi:spore coat protein U-like protein